MTPFLSLALALLSYVVPAFTVYTRAESSTLSSLNITTGTIVVDADGSKLSYTDSGAPSNADYVTIFTVNGFAFNANIWSRAQSVAVSNGLRLVAVNRRGYGNSTPFTGQELSSLLNGTDVEKASATQSLGIQLLTFIDTFAEQHKLANVSADRKKGGAVLVPWSFGCSVVMPALAAITAVPQPMQARLAKLMRAVIMEESPANGLGMSFSAQAWLPEVDPLFPVAIQTPYFAQWISAYFDHSDLSTRDPDRLQFILPSFLTAPAVYNDPPVFDLGLEPTDNAALDNVVGASTQAQLLSAYKNGLFNSTIRNALPNMKAWLHVGSRTAAVLIETHWAVQDDATSIGGQFVDFKLTNGTNHLLFWDFPKETISLYQELMK